MYSRRRPNWNASGACGLLAIATALQLLFLFFLRPEYHAISMAHGNVAFNVYRYNQPAINSALAHHMTQLQNGKAVLIDFDVVRHLDFGPPDKPFPVNDTIGYGVLLGRLWKLTDSLSFKDVIILQFLFYLVMVLLLWYTSRWLFADDRAAWYTTIAFLAYLPLIALNLHAVRDVWAAYGVIMVLYALVGYLHNKITIYSIVAWFIVIATCMWIRPSLFLAIITATAALIVIAIMQREYRRKSITACALMWTITISLFWLPLMYHNNITYGRLLVGPVGQDLLEGLGEFTNPWGHQLSDEYVASYIGTKYGLQYGTPSFDDAAHAEFNTAYTQQPSLFWQNMIRRTPMLILPVLPWIFYEQSPYYDAPTKIEKIKKLITTPRLWFDLLLRYGYMWFYLLLGYGGSILLFMRKRYDVLLVIAAVLCASWAKLPSHIEYRYLTPYYWVLCLSIGHLMTAMRAKKEAH